MLRVNEIFHSIQGESLHAGRPCVFVRMTGCNLRCRYCDTTYAYSAGAEMELEDVLTRLDRYGCPLVELTGGEPLLQPETALLATRLLGKGYEVLLETNGTQDIEAVDSGCTRIMDIKCPSSGENDSTDLSNILRLTDKDQIKFVIADQTDFKYAESIVTDKCRDISRHQILFSPVHGVLPPSLLADWLLRSRLNVRLHLQLHRYIWPDRERGV